MYQRKGKPCLVCATPVELHRLPPYDRTMYLCSVCQPRGPAADDST